MQFIRSHKFKNHRSREGHVKISWSLNITYMEELIYSLIVSTQFSPDTFSETK